MKYRRAVLGLYNHVALPERRRDLRLVAALIPLLHVRLVGQDFRRALLQSVFGADGVRQDFVLDAYGAHGVLRNLRRVRRDRGHGLPGEQNEFPRARRLVPARLRAILLRGLLSGPLAPGGDLLVRRADYGAHAGNLSRLRRINADDARVRVRRAHDATVEHAGQATVVRVEGRAAHLHGRVHARQTVVQERVLVVRAPLGAALVVNLYLDHRLDAVNDLRDSDLLLLLGRCLVLHNLLRDR